jgi:predicted nucleic acid-binding protein
MKKIADSGLLIAALDNTDTHHRWAATLLGQGAPPWLVCEAVLTEVSGSIGTPEPVLEMLRVGDLELAFDLADNKAEVLALVKKYRDQGMDLADACVVRMSELLESSTVYTVDRKDFSLYRRKGRLRIVCEFPGGG